MDRKSNFFKNYVVKKEGNVIGMTILILGWLGVFRIKLDIYETSKVRNVFYEEMEWYKRQGYTYWDARYRVKTAANYYGTSLIGLDDLVEDVYGKLRKKEQIERRL